MKQSLEKKKKSSLSKADSLFAGFLFAFLVVSFIKIFFFNNFWFDPAFSLEYVSQNSYWSMISNPVDVHPPVYYMVLKAWLFLMNESIAMAAFLSVLCGLVFAFFLRKVLFKLFEDDFFAVFASGLILLCSTYVNLFTEIRMYSLTLVFVIISFYSLVMSDSAMERKGYYFSYVCFAFLAVWTHYYAVFYVLMSFFWSYFFKGKEWFKENLANFVIRYCLVWMFLLLYFYFQFSKIDGMWFQGTNIYVAYLSSLNYALFNSGIDLMSNIDSLIAFIVALCLVLLFVMAPVFEDKKYRRYLFMLMIFALMPQLLGLIVNEFYSVYHHRFFIFTLWAFAVVVFRSIYLLLVKFGRRIFLVLFFCIVFFNLILFYNNSMTELVKANEFVNEYYCNDSSVFVLHESPFSSVASQYYKRIDNCSYQLIMYSELTDRQLASAGGVVISKNAILNETELNFLINNLVEGQKIVYYKSEDNINLVEGGLVLDLDGLDHELLER